MPGNIHSTVSRLVRGFGTAPYVFGRLARRPKILRRPARRRHMHDFVDAQVGMRLGALQDLARLGEKGGGTAIDAAAASLESSDSEIRYLFQIFASICSSGLRQLHSAALL